MKETNEEQKATEERVFQDRQYQEQNTEQSLGVIEYILNTEESLYWGYRVHLEYRTSLLWGYRVHLEYRTESSLGL